MKLSKTIVLIALCSVFALSACGTSSDEILDKNTSEVIELEEQTEAPSVSELLKDAPQIICHHITDEHTDEQINTKYDENEQIDTNTDTDTNNTQSTETQIDDATPAVSEPAQSEVQPAEANNTSPLSADASGESKPSASNLESNSSSGYTYTDVSKTMYASLGLNVRSGPSVSYDIISSYEKGDSVKVTGTCNETGWSRVDINGSVGYVDTNYLTDTAPAKANTNTNTNISSSTSNTAQNNSTASTDTNTSTSSTNTVSSQTQTETYTPGAFPLYNYAYHSGQYLGRVRIPSVGVNVAIYNSNSQATCDASDSAMCFYAGRPYDYYNYTIFIGDHCAQGFDVTGNCTIGCALYIDGANGNTYKYICDSIDHNGHHYDNYPFFTTSNNRDISCDGGIWTYTCNGSDWTSITIIHFSPA